MDQQFSLSWNNFHGNLSKGFASLLGKAEFVDVTIAVEGHLLQAHKVILSICSPYFKKMFLLNPCQHPIVVLRDVTYRAMKDLLQFMYQGEVSVKREDLNSFIGTAELLEIKGLTNKQGDENNENDHEVNENASTNDMKTNHIHNETSQNEVNLKKQCEIIQRLHKFTSLKRKSEEFLQKNYFSTDIFINADKRQKLKEKYIKTSDNAVSSNSFESYHNIYSDSPSDSAINYTNKSDHNLSHDKDTPNSRPKESITPDTNVDIKPECSDDDIIVSELGACTTPKSFESRLKDGDFSMTQENCTSFNALFMDIKSLANGKSDLSRSDFEDTTGNFLASDHHLVTIPQKEDGKKKYPQRSCRLCWKMGKRRDTRFMCKSCELPFCKYPCFDMHYQNYVKAAQLHRSGGNEFLTT